MALSSRIRLEELVALNDEMAALARARVPLGEGLRAVSGDRTGRLSRMAEQLSERLERGESLLQALEAAGGAFSPVYRAVVAAGLRSGQLAAALESTSVTVRRVLDLRRLMLASLVYPLIVLLLASGLFLFSVSKTGPVVFYAYAGLHVPRPAWYEQWWRLALGLRDLLPWLWLVLLVLLAVWWYRSSRATVLIRGGLLRVPSLARVLHAGRVATFAELLALMVEQQVPLDEAVGLSAAASGDRRLAQAGRQLAESIRQGAPVRSVPAGVPPLLGWLVATGADRGDLVKSLRQTAAGYRRRAQLWGTWLSVYLPIFLSAGIGGLTVTLYVLFVLAPFYNLLTALN